MIRPWWTLLTLLIVGALCGMLMLIFPDDGVKLGTVELTFPTWRSFLAEDSVDAPDVNELLEDYALAIDSTSIHDSISTYRAEQRKKLLALQLPKGDHPLKGFVESLERTGHKQIRVLHYGDSQIEGDRISSFLREQWQREYGGWGPGALPAVEFVPNFSVEQEASSNWQRYTRFGKLDTNIRHDAYGFRAIFNRFTPYYKDSLPPVDTVEAWLRYSPSRMGFSHVRRFDRARLFFGQNRFSFRLMVFADGKRILDRKIGPTGTSGLVDIPLEKTPKELEFRFRSLDGPDVYAVSLESPTGIHLDNIAMRGASGVVFRKLDRSQLASQLQQLDVGLVILQYGGNTVPYIDSEKKAEQYGSYFASQLRLLKRLLPNAGFVLIGPSDMATKVDGEFQTYPFLPSVRDALKKAALENGVAFWDLYEVMGGWNSMPGWVDAKPPLAGPDYVHFTPKGAKKVAELFHAALDKEIRKIQRSQADSIVEPADSTILP